MNGNIFIYLHLTRTRTKIKLKLNKLGKSTSPRLSELRNVRARILSKFTYICCKANLKQKYGVKMAQYLVFHFIKVDFYYEN